jgi:hypothetical protein
MSGTAEGGRKLVKTNYAKYGRDFYKRIGSAGGKIPHPNKGFGTDWVGKDGLTGQERASIAGKKGGAVGRLGSTWSLAQRQKHAETIRRRRLGV